MLPNLDVLTDLLIRVSREELLPRFAVAKTRIKADGSVVTDADFIMQERMQTELAHMTPDYRLLGEEMSEAAQRELLQNSGDGLWCLDPVDGTSNFAAGIPFFSVSLSLIIDSRPVLGMVYDPIRDECFSARAGHGAWLNGKPLPGNHDALDLKRCLGVIDFKRLRPELAATLATAPPYRSQRNFGSVALEWCWLAANRFQLYLHGQQKLWDYAAGILIFKEAGGCAETLAGGPMPNRKLQTSSALAALSPPIFAQWKNWLEAAQGRPQKP